MRACHIRDGAAVVEFLTELEHDLVQKKKKISEVDLDLRVSSSLLQYFILSYIKLRFINYRFYIHI